MAKFNWDKFKSGELSVILRTKELAEDFYEKCKKHEVDWGACNYAIWNDYHKEGIVYEFDVSTNSLAWCHTKHITGDSIEWKGENKMEKTFREVIADIKEGEVWVQTEEGYVTERIYCVDGGIYLTLKQSRSSFGTSGKYKLERKEYTFEEAFKAYEEGKEIESCIEGQRYKKEGGEDYYFDFNKEKYILLEWDKDIFTITSIRNKWYIND